MLLLKYFEIEGRFPRRQRDVAQAEVDFVARQLKIHAAIFAKYNWRGRTVKFHRAAIRKYLGFREGTVADAEAVSDWLCAHILPVEATLDGLIAAMYKRYRVLRIEPPAAGRVQRLVRSAQRRYSEQFCEEIAAQLAIETKQALDRLLERRADKDGNLAGQSSFARLNRDAGAVSLKNILAEIEKLRRIRQVALPETLFATVPLHVVELYRERVTAECPSEVKRHSDALRDTLLAAFCYLLGFQLLPRLKPINRQKLYRPYKTGGDEFARLKPILTRPIRWSLIMQHYDEMIRYATALRLGTAEAEALLQRFTKHGVQHPTYKALVELGKAVKSVFLCEYLHSLELRREIHEGLNVIENWNSANSFIFYGRSSEISTNDRQAQEVSVLALHLLQVSMVYINTLMIQRVLLQPTWANRMETEDLRALTPLIYAHVNPYGRFELDMETRLPLD